MGEDRSCAGWIATAWLICIKPGRGGPRGDPAVRTIGYMPPPAGEMLELQPHIIYAINLALCHTLMRDKEHLDNTLKLKFKNILENLNLALKIHFCK